MLKEFRDFAFKGNVVDLAVGVVIGAAFGKIIAGVVDDLIMPVVGLMLPSGNWREAGLVIGHRPNPSSDAAVVAARPLVDVKITYGHLLGVAIDFTIVAIVLFLVVRAIARAQKSAAPAPAPAPATRECPACLEPVALQARRCRHCTEALPPA